MFGDILRIMQAQQPVVLVLVTSVSVLSVLGTLWYKKRKRDAVPLVWKPVGKIGALYLYPLKSGRRLKLVTAECTEYGLKQSVEEEKAYQMRDRCLVVYNNKHKEFVTARTYPKMILIEVSVHDQFHFAVDAPGMRTLYVPIPYLGEENVTEEITLWSTKTLVIDCGEEAATWLSRYILDNQQGLRLGFHDGTHRRDITKTEKKEMKVFKNLSNESTGMYSDLAAFLLVNKSSVEDLNSRIEESTVTIDNFRPNIVIKDAPAYAEDHWDWIKMGEVIFRNVKPCTRCILTTINPETGVRHEKGEPLHTLETYRQLQHLYPISWKEKSPVMGQNLGLIHGGFINVGDEVCVGKS